MIRINQIKLPINHTDDDMKRVIRKNLKLRDEKFEYKIVKKSIVYKEISRYQTVDFDFSILVDKNVKYYDIERVVNNSGLEYLDLSVWDLKKCTIMSGCFENCSKLKTLIMPTLTPEKVKTSNGDNYMTFQSMLRGCSSLKEFDISHWEEINVSSVYRLMEETRIETFNLSCINLKADHLGYSMPPTQTTLVNATFYKTFLPNRLSDTNPFQNFTLASFTQLSKESLLSFLNCLADITSSGKSYTIPLGSANLAKLSSDEIKIAIDKGWSVG